MPDWRRLVSRRLHRLDVPPARRDEIAREMAGFLEDLYAERLRLGDSPRTARRAAFAGAGRWPDVVRELERVEGPMTHRLKALWLPGLGVSVAAMALLLAVSASRGGVGVRIVWHPPHPPIFFYWPWLLALPLLGAAGSAWSSRNGGDHRERLLVALFPALAFLALFPLPLVVVLATDAARGIRLLVLMAYLVNWVLLPGVALLLGGWPALRWLGARRAPART
jgi:hypothetical protein